jgi:EmrB/QacA subfamily drug resistance transporter
MSDAAPSPASPPAVAKPHVSLGIIVAIACVAQFMVVLDTTIVNVALPSMRHDLGLSTNAQQWVVDGYLITFGGFLLLSARASDLFGRKWVFQAGLVLFSVASLVGGLATTGSMLLVARIVQGIGASALAPSSLSLITASHTDGNQRTRALTIWGAAASSAGAVGMVLGGVLTAELSWRYVLFVNVPIGVALFIAATAYLLPSTRTGDRPRLDLPGALTVTLGTGLLVYGVSEATSDGWGSTTVVGALAAAGVLLASFIFIESRTAEPLVRLGIFANRGVRIANMVQPCLGVLMTATIFFLSLYVQDILGYSALRAGLSLVPMTLVVVVGSFVCRLLIPVFATRVLAVAGSLVAAGGLVWLSWIPVHAAYFLHVFGPTVVLGIGFSLMLLPTTIAATTGIAPREAGLASGLINMGRQIGGAIGLAVLVTIATSATHHSHIASPAGAVVHGYQVVFVIDAAIGIVAALIALRLPAIGKRPAHTATGPALSGGAALEPIPAH